MIKKIGTAILPYFNKPAFPVILALVVASVITTQNYLLGVKVNFPNGNNYCYYNNYVIFTMPNSQTKTVTLKTWVTMDSVVN